MTEVELPPHVAATAWLREQRRRKAEFRDWLDMVDERDWRAGRLLGGDLDRFASDFEEQLECAGAFAIERCGDPARLKLKVAKGYDVSGVVLWPIGIGQSDDAPETSYAEDAVALVRVGGSFNRGRVIAYEAPLQLCFTRHALERLIERGATSSNLERSLAPLSQQLIRDAGLALALGIAKESRDEVTCSPETPPV